MPTWLLPMLLHVLPEVPSLVEDGANLFEAIAHGSGGAKKVLAAIQGAHVIAAHAADALAKLPPVDETDKLPPAGAA